MSRGPCTKRRAGWALTPAGEAALHGAEHQQPMVESGATLDRLSRPWELTAAGIVALALVEGPSSQLNEETV